MSATASGGRVDVRERVTPRELATLDTWLRPDTEWSLADEYPTVFGSGESARSFVVRDGDTMRAHAATQDVDVAVYDDVVRARMVGSVVVDPALRGQGLGKDVVAAVVDDFRSSDADLLLLWSDKPEFYETAGFRHFGCELVVVLGPRQQDSRVRAYRDDDFDAVVRMHEAKPARVRRSPGLMRRQLSIPETAVSVLEEGGAPVAYACVGKGLDFREVVHECGGDDASLKGLLGALPATHALLPPWRLALAASLGPVYPQYMSLALVANEPPADFYIEGLDSI